MSKANKIGIGLGVVVLTVILFAGNSSLNKGSLKFISSQPAKSDELSGKKTPAPTPPPPAPDLQVVSVNFPPPVVNWRPIGGTPVVFTATVRNVGNAPVSRNFSGSFAEERNGRIQLNKASYYYYGQRTPLPPGGEFTQTWQFVTPSGNNNHRTKYCIDFPAQIGDTNSSNNCAFSNSFASGR